MIFNEVYSCYYNAVAELISLAIDQKLTEDKIKDVAGKYAFQQSEQILLPNIKNQWWQLIGNEFRTPIKQKPTMPMTALEKRWLKTILLDPRVKLFQIPMDEMDDVEPLYEPDDLVYFDRYTDGDSYDTPEYIEHFHQIRQAIRERRKIRLEYCNNRGQEQTLDLAPIYLEYSDKEDKFRALCEGEGFSYTINLQRIKSCTILEETHPKDLQLSERKRETLVFELLDEKNTLERAMMRLSHYEKRAERIAEKRYRIELNYDVDDETDVLIQIMSFGMYIQVISPDSIRQELGRRIQRQLDIFNQ